MRKKIEKRPQHVINELISPAKGAVLDSEVPILHDSFSLNRRVTALTGDTQTVWVCVCFRCAQVPVVAFCICFCVLLLHTHTYTHTFLRNNGILWNSFPSCLVFMRPCLQKKLARRRRIAASKMAARDLGGVGGRGVGGGI